MENRLVDTDVLSFILKGDSRAQSYAKHLEGRVLCLCFATVAELYRWAIQKNWGPKRIDDLRRTLRRYVVLPYDDAMAWEWARVTSIPGRPVAPGDAWIAAASLRHRISLVTHNRRHFEHIPGIDVVSEG